MKTINVNIKNYIIAAITALAVTATGCSGYMKSNNLSQLVYGLFFTTTPVLNPVIGIPAWDTSSISMAQPGLISSGNPFPTVLAYIGLTTGATPIAISGATVTNCTECAVDVSTGGHTFNGLAGNQEYRIYVVAQNSSGYSVSTITQSTGGIAPVMNALATSGVTSTEITIDQPTFSTVGNPAPTVDAWIGLDGTISVTGSTVNNFSDGPYDVSGGNHQFTLLLPMTTYRIIVVAQNGSGYSVRQIVQSTDSIAPVMDPLSLSGVTESEITIDQPTYATSGNPTPTTYAYIGFTGTITQTGSVISNYTDGPYDVYGSSHQFTGLLPDTSYTIWVVSQNVLGYDVESIATNTGGVAPVMDPLSLSGVTESEITIDQPTYATSGNPTPTTYAYIGLTGTITRTGSLISNYTDGPYNVYSGSHQFTGLLPDTSYTIWVVSQNGLGYDARSIATNTGGVAPVMDPLSLSGVTESEITIDQPTYTTSGNPTPTTYAYIGLTGTITQTGSVISNYTDGPYNVYSGSHQFTGLLPDTSYTIWVVSQNGLGYDARSIATNTGGAAPVLDPLSTSGVTSDQITIDQPTYATSGNPTPTTFAYIGLTGTITEAGGVISNYTDGPYNIYSGSHQFTALLPDTSYTIWVVSQNSLGYDAQSTAATTLGTIPALNAISAAAGGGDPYTRIVVAAPTYTGDPSPTVSVYIGISGIITINAGTGVVSGYLDGPHDASSGYTFTGLTAGTTYGIYMVVRNSLGFAYRYTTASTTGDAPTLNPISITAAAGQITLNWPITYTGVPTPVVMAYIGSFGVISESGGVVSNYIDGPYDVSASGHIFGGLTSGAQYTVIVVVVNSSGSASRSASAVVP